MKGTGSHGTRQFEGNISQNLGRFKLVSKAEAPKMSKIERPLGTRPRFGLILVTLAAVAPFRWLCT